MSPRAPRTIGSGWKIRKLGRRWKVGDQGVEQDDSQMNALGSHLRVTAHPGSLWGVSWDSCGSRNPRLPPEGMAGGSVTLSLTPWVQALWPPISSPPSPLAAFTQPPLPRTPSPAPVGPEGLAVQRPDKWGVRPHSSSHSLVSFDKIHPWSMCTCVSVCVSVCALTPAIVARISQFECFCLSYQ